MLAVLSGATAIAARIDEPTLAAHQIAASLLLFLALALDALAIPAQTLVAEQLGGDDAAEAPALSARGRAAVDRSPVRGSPSALAVARAAAPPRSSPPTPAVDRPGHVGRCGGWPSMLLPAAIAFAYDGVLIGAGDYRFLGVGRPRLPRRRRPARRASRCVGRRPASPASGRRSPCGWLLRAVVNHRTARPAAASLDRRRDGQTLVGGARGRRRPGRGPRSAPR